MEEKAYKKVTQKKIITDSSKHLEEMLKNCLENGEDRIEEKFHQLKKQYKEYKEALKDEKVALYSFGSLNSFFFNLFKPSTVTVSITKTHDILSTGKTDKPKYSIKQLGEWVGLLTLQDECFKWNSSEGARFELCWFKSMTRDFVPIGEFPNSLSFVKKIEDHLDIELGNGAYCWKGGQKKTILKLLCGNDNAIQRVIETGPCNYMVNFITPAIC
jgi:hypothetical protein